MHYRMKWALSRDVSAPPKVLLVALVALLQPDSDSIIVTQAALADYIGRNERWVREHMRTLADAGLVRVERRAGALGPLASRYHVQGIDA